jgi:2-(1,2-epoxy-1,2-dihydrophenyl)acetyl-CoA isomerase
MDVTDDDGVRRITFDRPDVLNAMSSDTAVELADAIEGADPDAQDAVVVTGEGDAFSAGGDIEAMRDRLDGPGGPAEAYDHLEESFGRIVEAAFELELPVVARVNGDAVGAGLSVAAVCDLAYAAESARFSCAFVRVGLVPDAGGSFLLPQLVGLRAAKRLAFTGEFVDAAEAADLGLVTEAVPDDDLDDRVEAVVDRLRDAPTKTVGLTKRAIHESLGRPWPEALEYEHLTQVQAYGTDEHREGVEAFLEKRDPDWD